jgi:hypothetical protein
VLLAEDEPINREIAVMMLVECRRSEGRYR